MKNCKSKGLRMATGGVLEESAALRHRMAEKYGVTTGDEAAQAPSQPQAPTGQAQPTQPKQGGLRGLLSSFQRHFDQVDKAANMAKGGIVVGKHSEAPKDSERREKARTADQVPVNLSIDEAVLPAKTVDALGGPEAVEELIEQTNGKEPVTKGLRAGGNYAGGAVPEDQGFFDRVAQGIGNLLGDNLRGTPEEAADGGAMKGYRQLPGGLQVAGAEGAQPAQPEIQSSLPAQTSTFDSGKGLTRFQAKPDAGQYEPAAGTGFITRSPGRDGLRKTIVMGPGAQFDENGMDATDRQYAAAGYGKDANGNWMTPARQSLNSKYAAMKAQQAGDAAGGPAVVSTGGGEAERLQKQLDWDRFGTPSIMERDGIGAAMRMQRQAGLAHQIDRLQQNELGRRGQDMHMLDSALNRNAQLQVAGLRSQPSAKDVFEMQREMMKDQREAGKDRQAAYNTQQATQQGNYKMIQEALDRMFPTQGLKDDALAATQAQRASAERAFMAANGGNMPTDQAEFQRALPAMLAQADLTGAINHTVANPSVMDRLSNLFHGNFDRTVGDAAVVPKMLDDGKTMQLPNGLRIDTKKVIGNSADRAAALNSRLAQAQAQLSQQ